MTVLQEARGQPLAGKRAVAEVIRNRISLRYQSDGSVSGTVLRPYQFSGWNTRDVNRIRCATADSDYPEAAEAVQAWRLSAGPDLVLSRGAVLYLNPSVVDPLPAWANPAHRLAIIGAHHFFTDPILATRHQPQEA